ncbi:MAG: SRPBCC family protein [Candidatus Kapaibacterium sp.]
MSDDSPVSKPSSRPAPRSAGTHVLSQLMIRSSASSAYAACANPELLSQWFTTGAQQDVHVGGRYSNNDGDSGEFLEVVPNQRLKFTWEQPRQAPGSRVTIEFIPQGVNEVHVRLTHSNIETEEDLAGLEDGWRWALDSLKSFLERGIGIRYAEWTSGRR